MLSSWLPVTTYISSSFQKSPCTCRMISQAGLMEGGDVVYGYCIYIITLQWDKKVYNVILPSL